MNKLQNDPIQQEQQTSYIILDSIALDFFKDHTVSRGISRTRTKEVLDAEALKTLLQNYPQKVLSAINNSSLFISIGCKQASEYHQICILRKDEFVNDINDLKNDENLDNHEKKLINKINDVFYIHKDAESDLFRVLIDNKAYLASKNALLNFLLKGYKEIDIESQNNFMGLSKNEFFYILKSFLKTTNLQDRIFIDLKTRKFMKDVLNDKYANTYQFNKHLETKDYNLNKVVLNEKFVDHILKDMPKDYNALQKSIYIYIKLCKSLSYDPEFYANNQGGMIAREHEDINRLSKIDTEMNKIVCYEFSQIYAKFLNIIGVNYDLDGGIGYGSSHNFVEFRVGDFLVEADSVRSILSGDLFNAKTNNSLSGLQCVNTNIETQKKFYDECDKVYEYIIEKENNPKKITFEETLDLFSDMCDSEDVTREQKMKIFQEQCRENKLPIIEKLSYLTKIAKNIFEKEIDEDQFWLTIISKKVIKGTDIRSLPSIICSYNDVSFEDDVENTKYIEISDNGDFVDLSRSTVMQKFQSGIYKHITAGSAHRHIIPGIDPLGDDYVK